MKFRFFADNEQKCVTGCKTKKLVLLAPVLPMIDITYQILPFWTNGECNQARESSIKTVLIVGPRFHEWSSSFQVTRKSLLASSRSLAMSWEDFQLMRGCSFIPRQKKIKKNGFLKIKNGIYGIYSWELYYSYTHYICLKYAVDWFFPIYVNMTHQILHLTVFNKVFLSYEKKRSNLQGGYETYTIKLASM